MYDIPVVIDNSMAKGAAHLLQVLKANTCMKVSRYYNICWCSSCVGFCFLPISSSNSDHHQHSISFVSLFISDCL